MKLLFAISFVVFIQNAISFDYCDKSLCDYGTHIGCGHDGQVAEVCRDTSEFLDSPKLRKEFVELHNKFRNEIASGKNSKYQPAARMATMTWDDELAKIAKFNVMQCKMKHDSCRNTPDFKYAGQNLANWWGPKDGSHDKDAAITSIDLWFEEWQHGTMDVINKFARNRNPAKEYGHFTVMMADRNIKLGCAVMKTELDGAMRYLSACNYATTNMIDSPIYKSGPAASECTTGKNPKYPALCSEKEQYDVNNWW